MAGNASPRLEFVSQSGHQLVLNRKLLLQKEIICFNMYMLFDLKWATNLRTDPLDQSE